MDIATSLSTKIIYVRLRHCTWCKNVYMNDNICLPFHSNDRFWVAYIEQDMTSCDYQYVFDELKVIAKVGITICTI
jgi:hypothetical protein